MIVAFDPVKHGEALKEWLMFYDLPKTHFDEIPEIGFMAEDEDGFIAAGFIRKIENCSLALIDGLIANPESLGKRRYHAIDQVVEKLIEFSKSAGLKQLIGFSVDAGTIKRSIKHGFRGIVHAPIALDL